MHKTILFFLAVASLHVCNGQDTVRRNPDVLRFSKGVLYTYSGPARWNKNQWLGFGAVVGGAGLLMLVDEPVQEFWANQNSKFLDRLERVGFHYGKPYSAFTATSVFYIGGAAFKNEWMRDTGLALGIGLLSGGLIQTFLKEAAGRTRPSAEKGAFEYDPFRGGVSYHSFPSGHVTVALGISYIIARRSEALGVKIVFYSLAGITAMSRMYANAHWSSDIALGGVLAVACGEAAVRFVEAHPRLGRRSSQALNFYPAPTGFSLVWKL